MFLDRVIKNAKTSLKTVKNWNKPFIEINYFIRSTKHTLLLCTSIKVSMFFEMKVQNIQNHKLKKSKTYKLCILKEQS